jgi:15-cis-phytoene desaturase
VAVIERDAWLGGRAASWRDESTGDMADIGPHVITTEHRNFLALLERLGTAGQVLWQRQPLITLCDAGQALHMPASSWPPPLHGLPLLPNALRRISVLDAASHWRLAWHGARLDEQATLALDGESAVGYLRRMGVRERAIEWFWRSAMLALLNVPLERCSAAAAMRVFRLAMGRSGYCFGLPQVGLSELFAPGCVARIGRAGGLVRTGVAVQRLVGREGRFGGFILEEGTLVKAACGVLALPPQAVGALAQGDPALATLAHAAGRFEPSPYISSFLWFDRPLTRERFWGRVWNPSDLNTDFYDLSNIRPALQGGPALIACNAIHTHDEMDWTDAEVIEKTRREIADFAPQAAQARVVHARVHRVPMAIPCPLPGSETLRPASATGLTGLWLAGDWTATAVPCSMESATRSAALAAEGVLARLGRAKPLAIAAPETTGMVALLRRRATIRA